jgi:hypothetical protein
VAISCEYGDEPSGSGAMELVIFKFWNLVVKENLRVYSNILVTKCEKTRRPGFTP